MLDAHLDLAGFKNREARDLTGLVDCTANDKDEARGLAAQIPEGELRAGGVYVLTQKWKNHLTAFNELSVSEQEYVIGRRKPDEMEMSDDQMPNDSHVIRTDLDVDGVAQTIYR